MKRIKIIQYLCSINLLILLSGCSASEESKNATMDLPTSTQEEANESTVTNQNQQSQELINVTTEQQTQATPTLTVPSNVKNSIIEINQILNKTSIILSDIEKISSTLPNIYAENDIKTLRNQFLDNYLASTGDFRNITIYKNYDKIDLDNPIKGEIYDYAIIYQDAMDEVADAISIFLNGNNMNVNEKINVFNQGKAAFELKLEEANQLLEKIDSSIEVGTVADYNNIPISEDISAALLLDLLWITHQRIWEKQGEYFEEGTTMSKLGVDEALEQIDPMIGSGKAAIELLKTFSMEYNLEPQDEWNLDEANGVIDNWHTAINDHLYAIQIYGIRDKAEEYFNKKIPPREVVKYDIRYEMQMINYSGFYWQYSRARDFLRTQELSY